MNRPSRRTLVVGIGSAHGDDQAGWQLIDTLAARNQESPSLRKASVPHDMIDWLAECDTLHVVDACDGENEVRRVDVSDGRIGLRRRTRSHNSHQIGVGGVLELAKSLGRLPDRVMLWAIPGQHFQPNGDIGDNCMKQVKLCASLIQRELADA